MHCGACGMTLYIEPHTAVCFMLTEPGQGRRVGQACCCSPLWWPVYSTIALCILHATPCRHGVYMTCTRTFPRALAMHTGIGPKLRPHTKTRPLRGDSSNTTSSNLYLVSEQSVVPPLTCIHPRWSRRMQLLVCVWTVAMAILCDVRTACS